MNGAYRKAILMSIRPKYAEKIFNGTKTIELRRVKPKHIQSGDLVFVYVSSPVKSLVGAFGVSKVIEAPILDLWSIVEHEAGISQVEFENYYQKAESGVAIYISNVWLLPKPIELADLKRYAKGFHPPQSYRYTSIKYFDIPLH
jgi:predicted transcriptional regulator